MNKGSKAALSIALLAVAVAVAGVRIRSAANRLPRAQQVPKTTAALQLSVQEAAAQARLDRQLADSAAAQPQRQALFLAAAASQDVEAQNGRELLRAIGADLPESDEPAAAADDDLQNAWDTAAREATSTAPDAAATAKKEHFTAARQFFGYARDAANSRADAFYEALSAAGLSQAAYCVCPHCGRLYRGDAPTLCGSCGTPGHQFAKF